MQTFETEIVKKVVAATTTCDICKTTKKGDNRYWAPDSNFAIEQIKVESVITTSYEYIGDGGTTSIKYDICPTCFRKHLIPFLESFQAKPDCTNVDEFGHKTQIELGQEYNPIEIEIEDN